MKIKRYLTLGAIAVFLIGAHTVENEVINRIASQLISYVEKQSFEKVYVHTDRVNYRPGDIIWLQARLFDASTHTQTAKSKVIHLAFLDHSGDVLFDKKLWADNGQSSGDILLPDTLSEGSYLLRGYTNWMKNSPQAYFFEKEIIVSRSGNYRRPKTAATKIIDVSFYPEGGQLNESFENNVAFKVNGENGKTVDATGWLTDDKQDTISPISSNGQGLGSFRFIPEKGRSYQLALMYQGDTTTFPLPKAKAEGINMLLRYKDNERVAFTIQSSRKIIGENSKLFVLIQARGKVSFAAAAGAFSSYEMDIPIDKLMEGVNHLTVFSEAGEPLLERLIFKRPEAPALITIEGLKEQYQRSEKAAIRVKSDWYEEATFTVSIHDGFPTCGNSLGSYLLLTSELQDPVEAPQYYLEHSDSARQAADLLMLTQRSRYRWEQILGTVQSDNIFDMESEGQVFRGRLINNASGFPLTDTLLVISAYHEQPNFVFVRPEQDGTFTSVLPLLYGTERLSIRPAIDGNPAGYRFKQNDSFSHKIKRIQPYIQQVQLQAGGSFETERRALENYKLHVPEVFGTPVLEEKTDLFEPDKLMGEVKLEIFPSDYIQLNSVSEMVYELLPSVKIKNRKGQELFYVLNETVATSYSNNTWYEYEEYDINKEPASVFINGVLVTDHSRAMGLSYEDIYKVEVYNKKTLTSIGHQIYGAVAFTTNSYIAGDLQNDPLAPHEVQFDGLALTREYPIYAAEASKNIDARLPDLRHSLYWSAEKTLVPNEPTAIQFYTSLVAGDYFITIEGSTSSGVPIFHQQRFSVVK